MVMLATARSQSAETCGSPFAGRTSSTSSPRQAPPPIASEALERIAALYTIEVDIRGRSSCFNDRRHELCSLDRSSH
jgi:hypothetical protein